MKWWDPVSGELKQRLELPDEDLVSIAAMHSPDGQRLALVTNRVSTAMGYFGSRGPIDSLGSDPGIRALPQLLFDSDLRILDARTGETTAKLKDGFASSLVPFFPSSSRSDFLSMFRQPLRPMVFSPDGHVVAGWNSSEVRLWNSSTGAEVLKIKKFKGRLSAIAFSPDGHLLAAPDLQQLVL